MMGFSMPPWAHSDWQKGTKEMSVGEITRELPDRNNLGYMKQFLSMPLRLEKNCFVKLLSSLLAGNLPQSLWIKLHLHFGFIMLCVGVQVLNWRVLRLFMLLLMRRQTVRVGAGVRGCIHIYFMPAQHGTHAWL